jgi:hypothetical protein
MPRYISELLVNCEIHKYLTFSYSQNMLWEIPRCNIYSTIASDLLHQLKKGVWVYLMESFERLIFHTYDVREANRHIREFNKRFSMVPSFSGIKKFPHGISKMSQTTAKETAEIMKVFYF